MSEFAAIEQAARLLLDEQNAMLDGLCAQFRRQRRQQLAQVLLAVAIRNDDCQTLSCRERERARNASAKQLPRHPGRQLPVRDADRQIAVLDPHGRQRIATQPTAGPPSTEPALRRCEKRGTSDCQLLNFPGGSISAVYGQVVRCTARGFADLKRFGPARDPLARGSRTSGCVQSPLGDDRVKPRRTCKR